MTERYGWGIDGHGRCHLCEISGNRVLFCGLPGVGGRELVLIYGEYWP